MMRQETTAEVRLDANKAGRFNVSAQSTGGFYRLLPHTEGDLPLPKMPKGDDPGLATTRYPGNVG
jgi:hypothetical protein